MQTLIIEAVSEESAQGFLTALSEFETELVETGNGRYQVWVELVGNDRALVRLLRTLEDYVTARGDGPARLKLEGKSYMM